MTENKKVFVTDGQDLAERAEQLKADGVTDVTVVVNTFNFTRYQESNDGKELQPVIDGINKAVGQKLNITLHVGIKEGFNDDEILDFLQLIHKSHLIMQSASSINQDYVSSICFCGRNCIKSDRSRV